MRRVGRPDVVNRARVVVERPKIGRVSNSSARASAHPVGFTKRISSTSSSAEGRGRVRSARTSSGSSRRRLVSRTTAKLSLAGVATGKVRARFHRDRAVTSVVGGNASELRAKTRFKLRRRRRWRRGVVCSSPGHREAWYRGSA